jgi:hypothetical protein
MMPNKNKNRDSLMDLDLIAQDVTIGVIGKELDVEVLGVEKSDFKKIFFENFTIDDILEEYSIADIIESEGEDEVLKNFTIEDFLFHFGDKDVIKEIGVGIIIDQLGEPEILDEIGYDIVQEHFDTEIKFEKLGL